MIPAELSCRRAFTGLKSILMMSDILLFIAVCVVAIWIGPRNGLWITGLALAVPSFALWMIARRQLGNSFMIRAVAKELVATGLYRRIRHPIYLFGGLAMFGVLLAIQNWWVLVFWLVYTTPIQWIRKRREEMALEAEYGQAYVQLRRRTWI